MYKFYTGPGVACAPLLFLLACKGESASVATGTRNASSLDPHFTMGSGTVSTPLGRATFSDPDDQNFKVKRISGDWHIEIKSKPAFDVAIQSITFKPGSQSGWQTHPGTVFLQGVLGTMAVFKLD